MTSPTDKAMAIGATKPYDTVTDRKPIFQPLVMTIERKYDLSTKQAIAMIAKEMREACYV